MIFFFILQDDVQLIEKNFFFSTPLIVLYMRAKNVHANG